jgi:hypothetical protein
LFSFGVINTPTRNQITPPTTMAHAAVCIMANLPGAFFAGNFDRNFAVTQIKTMLHCGVNRPQTFRQNGDF